MDQQFPSQAFWKWPMYQHDPHNHIELSRNKSSPLYKINDQTAEERRKGREEKASDSVTREEGCRPARRSDGIALSMHCGTKGSCFLVFRRPFSFFLSFFSSFVFCFDSIASSWRLWWKNMARNLERKERLKFYESRLHGLAMLLALFEEITFSGCKNYNSNSATVAVLHMLWTDILGNYTFL